MDNVTSPLLFDHRDFVSQTEKTLLDPGQANCHGILHPAVCSFYVMHIVSFHSYGKVLRDYLHLVFKRQ